MQNTAAWISPMQAAVAPSIWKLTRVPSTLDPIDTTLAIASIRSNRSVSRNAMAPGATSMAITRMMPTACKAPTMINRPRRGAQT